MPEITSEAKELVVQVEKMATTFMDFKVTTSGDLMNAAELLKNIKGKAKEIDTQRKAMTAPLDESKKRIMDFFRKPLELLEKAEIVIKKSMLSYQQEQERLRQEEQKKAEEAARKSAEKEQTKIQKRADKAEAAGNDEKASELRQQAEEIRPITPIIESKVPDIQGIATKKVWKFKVTDISLIPREYLIVNEALLGNLARSTKGAVKVAGVEFYAEEIISASSRPRSRSVEMVTV